MQQVEKTWYELYIDEGASIFQKVSSYGYHMDAPPLLHGHYAYHMPRALHVDYGRTRDHSRQFERVIKAKVVAKVWRQGGYYIANSRTHWRRGGLRTVYKLPPLCDHCWRQDMKVYVFPGEWHLCGTCAQGYSSMSFKCHKLP